MTRRQDTDPEMLVIDRAVAAEIPTIDAIQEWAREKRGFISSVMSELPEERKAAAAAAIRKVGARPVMFEQFGGRDDNPEQAYLSEVETSDIYVGILGTRYGKPLPSRFSSTHSEYLHAEKHGLRLAVWTLKSSPDDLQSQIEDRLRTIAAEDLAPWCKMNNIVFRATEVADRGHELSITARVRIDDVAHALEGFRGERGHRGDDARFTWTGRSRYVRVKSAESTTTSARSRIMRLNLEAVDAPHDSSIEMSIGKLTPNDLTELALRTALFGDPNPLEDQHMVFFAELPDPLLPLRTARVSDEIVRPLAELLIADGLVGSGRAARITEFRLGVAARDRRQLVLSWEPPRRYSNERIKPKSITGEIQLQRALKSIAICALSITADRAPRQKGLMRIDKRKSNGACALVERIHR